MNLEEFMARYPDVKVPKDVIPFAKFLDQSGKRFLVDYGYENAKQMAQREIEKQTADKLPV